MRQHYLGAFCMCDSLNPATTPWWGRYAYISQKLKCRNGEAKALGQGHSGYKWMNQVSKALGELWFHWQSKYHLHTEERLPHITVGPLDLWLGLP